MAETKDFRRKELPVKYTMKMLYRWKFCEKIFKKVRKELEEVKSVSLKKKP